MLGKLHPASFDGVPFLYRTESASRGKKVILHEYPNCDYRYVEELGRMPSTFSIEAIIHGKDSKNLRLRLENALENKGLKKLVHPIYGILWVITIDFEVSSNQSEIGQFVFNINFSQSLENVSPEPDTPTASQISNIADKTRSAINLKMGEYYTAPKNKFNFDTITTTVQTTLKSVNDQINKVVDLSSKGAADFNRLYRSVTGGITSMVSSAQIMKQNITSFYAAALDAPVFVEQLSDAWDNLLKEPLSVPSAVSVTPLQAERRQNDFAVLEHMNLMALVGSYEAKAHKEYTTDTDLLADRNLLDSYYRHLTSSQNQAIADIELKSICNEIDIRALLAELRTTARAVFDEKEKAAFKVVDIDPGITSMSLACYRYYGSLEYIEQLSSLNPNVNHANIDTIIKALAP